MSLNFNNPVIIYNPKSGGGRGQKNIKMNYQKLIDNLFNNVDVYEIKSRDILTNDIIKFHKEKKYDLIISIGGDGTISSIVNAIMNIPKADRIPIFPLPSGSGDSLLRDFNIRTVDQAIENYKKLENTKQFDLLFLEELNTNFKCYCINVIGFGFVSDIAKYTIANMKKIGGTLSYILGMFSGLSKFKPYKTTLKYNKGKDVYEADKVYFMTVSNTKYTGGAVMIAPEAKYNDSLLDILILHDISRLKFLGGYNKAFKGEHIFIKKGVKYFKTTDVEIYAEPQFYVMPDGELEGNSPVKISVVSKEIELVV
jgi:diacylglycerol kinase (ATP)